MKKEEKEKIAIIVSGGGMACVYSAGALKAIAEKYGLLEPEIAIGCSGGVGILSYYLSGREDVWEKVRLEEVFNKKFVNPLRFWKIMDVDYLVDEVFRKKVPLDIEKIKSSKTEFLIPSTRMKDGLVRYSSSKSGEDIFLAIKAAKSLPIMHSVHPKIEGEEYCDTYLSCSVTASIQKAIEMGARKIIVIKKGEGVPLLNKVIYVAWALFRSWKFKKEFIKTMKEREKFEIPEGIKVIYLMPKNRLEISNLSMDSKKLKEAFRQGYLETREDRELERFLRTT